MDFDPTDEAPIQTFILSSTSSAKIITWNVAPGDKVRRGVPLVTYSLDNATSTLHSSNGDSKSTRTKEGVPLQLKSTLVGVVRETLHDVGVSIPPG